MCPFHPAWVKSHSLTSALGSVPYKAQGLPLEQPDPTEDSQGTLPERRGMDAWQAKMAVVHQRTPVWKWSQTGCCP